MTNKFTLTKTYDIHAIKEAVGSKAIDHEECAKLIALYWAVKKNNTLRTLGMDCAVSSQAFIGKYDVGYSSWASKPPLFQNGAEHRDLRCALFPSTFRCWLQITPRIIKIKLTLLVTLFYLLIGVSGLHCKLPRV